MARNRRYNYEPQVVDPGMIDFGSIQMYNPEDVDRMAQAGQAMQQRWDASQSVIAKQLEEIGAANINPRYKAEVVGKLEEDLDNIYSNVNTTYQGDFGRAYNDIIKSLSKSRALLHSATQASAEESKLREQYNQLAMQGLAPRVIVRTEQGLTPQTLSFEKYYQLPESVFDESGKFVAPQFGALRSAGKHENWLAQNVSDAINRAVVERDPTLLTGDLAGMAKAVTTGGMSDADVETYINNNPWIIENFIANSPFAKEEFSDGKGGIRMDDAKEYVTNIVKAQTSQQIKKQFMGSPSNGSSSGVGVQNNLRGLYTRVGMVSDEGDVKKNTVSSFLNKISGYDENKNLRDFISAGRHVDNPTEYPTINGKPFKPYNEIIVDYWENLAKNPVPITESSKLTPEAKAAIDNFFGSDFLTKNQTMSKETVRQVAEEVATKLRHELTKEEKKYKGIWDDYKSKYKDIYDIVQKQGGTDIQFLDAVDFVEQNNKKVQYSLTSIADPEENTYVGESVLNKIPGETKLKRINPGTFDKNHAKKVDLKLNPKSFSVNFYHGIMRMEDSDNGYIYEIPKESLPKEINKLMSVSQNILKKAIKYGESKTPDVLPYAETIESKFNTSGQRGYPVILYSLDENSLQNVMTKIYVEDPRKPIMDKSGNFTDNVFVNPDNTVIGIPYSTTDLEDYLMHKLSITFNPYSKKQ